MSGTTLAATPCPSGPYAGYYIYPEDRCNTPSTPPTIVVQPTSNGISSVSFTPNGGAVDIGITAVNDGNGSSFIAILANGSHIGTVSVTSANPIGVEVTIMTTGNVGGVLMDEGSSIQSMWVNGVIDGDLGNVKATGIRSAAAFVPLTVRGDLIGDIHLVDRVNDADLRLVDMIIEGTIAGGVEIDTESGGIGQVLVKGAIGESGDPVTVLSGRDITSIVTGEMYADIVVMREEDSVQYWGNIRQIRVQKDFEGSGSSGDFVGTIHANSVGNPVERSLEMTPADGPQIEIQGDLGDGTTTTYLEFESALAFDGTFHNAQIVVGEAFRNNATIEVPTGGLDGQIIFNRSNTGAAWQSTAKVLVGSTELDTTQYAATAASIGGGAAGRAEYRLHSTSCDPAEVWSGDPPTREPGVLEVEGHLELDINGVDWVCVVDEATVVIQFYGPVSISTDDEAPVRPVKVHKWDGDSWVSLEEAFSVSGAPGGDQKRLAITLANEFLGGSYRVTREPGGLLSNEVDEAAPDNPAGVNAFTYYFDVVGGSCESMLLGGFDLNSDQAVSEPGDLPAWLVSPVDLNNDSLTNTNDIPSLQSAAAMYGALPGAPAYFPGPFVDVE